MMHASFTNRILATALSLVLVMPAAQAVPLPSSPPAAQPGETGAQGSAVPDAPTPQPAQGAAQAATQSSQQSNSQAPVGTAAAPAEEPVGAAGSRPAGAVIAPGKQRRIHTFLISIGLVVGAGIAIGTVAALSHASPSQPH